MYTMSWSMAALCGPLASGFVLDELGANWLWGMCAVLGTVTALGYGLLVRRLPEVGQGPGDATVAGAVAAPEAGKDPGAVAAPEAGKDPGAVAAPEVGKDPAPGQAPAAL
jgi:MFS family permease